MQSLRPSPTKPTSRGPRWLRGRTSAPAQLASMINADFSSGKSPKCTVSMPTLAATACAAGPLSPLSITGSTPNSLNMEMVAWASVRKESTMRITAAIFSSTVTNKTVPIFDQSLCNVRASPSSVMSSVLRKSAFPTLIQCPSTEPITPHRPCRVKLVTCGKPWVATNVAMQPVKLCTTDRAMGWLSLLSTLAAHLRTSLSLNSLTTHFMFIIANCPVVMVPVLSIPSQFKRARDSRADVSLTNKLWRFASTAMAAACAKGAAPRIAHGQPATMITRN
mmetsp:Transcript_46159/g.132188  ORF Transcript_46159/g.132188 Transcript_46159/m.132188 type:complete len:278 (+) Transcript_46159:403-1236(+)